MGNYDLKYVKRAMKESSEIQRSTRGQAIVDRQDSLKKKKDGIMKKMANLDRKKIVINVLDKELDSKVLSYIRNVSEIQLDYAFFSLASDCFGSMTLDLKIPVSYKENVKQVDYGKDTKLDDNIEIYKDTYLNALGIKCHIPIDYRTQNSEEKIAASTKKFANVVNIVYELLEKKHKLIDRFLE